MNDTKYYKQYLKIKSNVIMNKNHYSITIHDATK